MPGRIGRYSFVIPLNKFTWIGDIFRYAVAIVPKTSFFRNIIIPNIVGNNRQSAFFTLNIQTKKEKFANLLFLSEFFEVFKKKIIMLCR